MVKSCCAIGYTNRLTKGSTLSFYCFPADIEWRRQWIAAINRRDWEPNQYSYICSAHFVSGKKSNDELSPDYVPSIFHHVGSPLKRRKQADLHAYHRRKQAPIQHHLQLNQLKSQDARLQKSEVNSSLSSVALLAVLAKV